MAGRCSGIVVVAILVILMIVSEQSFHAHAASAEDQEFLAAHNAVRSKVNIEPLVWSEELASYALKYARTQRDHHKCAMVHSQGPYGENLFWGYGKKYTPTDAVNSWESEIENYNYESNSCAPGKVCGHYTQVVWGNTKELGCASVTCHDGATFIICSYNPPGNYVGEWPYMKTGSKSEL